MGLPGALETAGLERYALISAVPGLVCTAVRFVGTAEIYCTGATTDIPVAVHDPAIHAFLGVASWFPRRGCPDQVRAKRAWAEQMR
jgi:hypothetical protein